MSIEYGVVEAIELDGLQANDSILLTNIIGSFKRCQYEVDIFKVTDEHVFGIAFVTRNDEAEAALSGTVQAGELTEEYVRFPRQGQLRTGHRQVALQTIPKSSVEEGVNIEDIDESLWLAPQIGFVALGLFRLQT